MKKLIPATIMLLVAAILMSTASFAWFSMNTQVTATSMQVKAVAEDGLLIHNELDADDAAHWLVSVNATYGSLAALAPTSSSDMSAWYHNKSNDPNNYAGVEAYETLSADTNWKRDTGESKTGVWFIDTDTQGDKDTNEKAYVLQNRFYIKSSGDAITLGTGNAYQALYINKVQVTGNTSSADLDKALRVAVKIGSEVFIYAPFSGATTSYNVNSSSTATTATSVPTNYIVNTTTAQTTIPAYTAALNATTVADVYIYFEGEDANCKSANITATLDSLSVEVVFGITQLPTT